MINRYIFSQVNLDSGALTVLASVVHKFSEPGEYSGEIRRGEMEVGQFKILVGQTATPQLSVKIDLKSLDLPVSQPLKNKICDCFAINPEGFVSFFVSTGAGGYFVEIQKSGKECGGAKVFDNRELKQEDMFVATVLRPGLYRVINATTKAEAELTVAYPEIGKTPRSSQAIHLECNEKAIFPTSIFVNPGQGLVFRFKVPSRIKIELVKPEDRPKQIPPENQVGQATKTAIGTPTKKLTRRIGLNHS